MRQLLRRMLPDTIKARLRSFVMPKSVSTEVEFESVNDGLMKVALSPDSQIYLPVELQSDLVSHLSCSDERNELASFMEASRTRSGFFDVGAHVGWFTTLYCSLNKSGKASVYEPSPLIVPHTERLLCVNNFGSRVTVRAVAIGMRQAEMEMQIDGAGFVQGHSYAGTQTVSSEAATSVIVPVTTIDSECERFGWTPELIKIDIEGFELEALRGAENTLRNSKPLLFIELHLNYLEERGIDPAEVTDFLSALGYKFTTFDGRVIPSRKITSSMQPVVRVRASTV